MITRLSAIALWVLLPAWMIAPILGQRAPDIAPLVILPLFVVAAVKRRWSAAHSSYDVRVLLGIVLPRVCRKWRS